MPNSETMTEQAKWEWDGCAKETLQVRPLIRARVFVEPDGRYGFTAMERRYALRFATKEEARDAAETELRRILTEALERLP